MNTHEFELSDQTLTALPSGALWWDAQSILVFSDLHLGKSDRIARRSGSMLPPFDTFDTLTRLDAELLARNPNTVICLGDSFDDLVAARDIDDATTLWLARMQAGREWIWIEGNHDPGPIHLGGTHRAQFHRGALTFRHIAHVDGRGEVSGHYHPKATLNARGRSITRSCFLYDTHRVILPAFGTYTGGLRTTDPALTSLMQPRAIAALTGQTIQVIPMPRGIRNDLRHQRDVPC